MQILIPMAGAGSRFAAAGYDRPKPFIEFGGKTMIQHVIDNLGVTNDFVLVAQQSHMTDWAHVFKNIGERVNSLLITTVDGLTSGPASSCLKAEHLIEPHRPLMIANSDQIMRWSDKAFKCWMFDSGLDGAIMTFDSQDPKNSFAEVGNDGLVIRTAEKEVISKHASNGIYVWRRADEFYRAARSMIEQDIRANGEFYVCPVYNISIANGQRVGIYPIDDHWPIGTPKDLTTYLDRDLFI